MKDWEIKIHGGLVTIVGKDFQLTMTEQEFLSMSLQKVADMVDRLLNMANRRPIHIIPLVV